MIEVTKILTWIKKTFTLKDVAFILGITAFFFLTRLIRLDKFPIFSDEGIYIHWAKVAWRDPAWRFYSLTDGKQPLQTWGTIPFLKLFPNNALLAGRLFSVSTGFIALIGVFSSLLYLFNKKTAYYGALLYVVTPYFLFYDRMALVDSGVNAGFIWMLFFSILLARTRRLDMALIFGFITGFSLLAKSSVRLFAGAAMFGPVFFFTKKIKDSIWKSIDYYVLFAITVAIGLLFYNVQRLSPFFHIIAEKNTTFVMSKAEFLDNPFQVLISNLQTIPTYVFWEMGWLIVLFSILGYAVLFKKDRRLFVYLFLWFAVQYFLVALVTKVLFPRYLIFFGSLLLITAAYYIAQIKSKKIQYLVFIGLVLYQIVFSYPIIFNPFGINFPPVDRGQYVNGATAVWGAPELVEYVREQSKKRPVLLLAEGDFGLVGDVMRVFLRDGDFIELRGIWPVGDTEVFKYADENKKKKVYWVFAQLHSVPKHWPFKLVKKYTKPGNDESALYLFEYQD